MGVGDDIYDSTASFGRFWALVGAIIASLIGLGLFIGGIYILVKKPDSDKVGVKGTIVKVNGNDSGQCAVSDVVICGLTVQYEYEGKSYTKNFNYSGKVAYYVGLDIDVYIPKGKPLDASLELPIQNWMGTLMIVISLFLVGGAWFWYWAARKWKAVAAAEGAGGLFNLFFRR